MKRTPTTRLCCYFAWLIVVTACSNETETGGGTGALSLGLDLTGGSQIDAVQYTITGNGIDPITGLIDSSAPGATASLEVFGLPPGDGYSVRLSAMADDGTSCEGLASFDVAAGDSTLVSVMLGCKAPERFGGVRVNGKPNVCPQLAKVVVAPLETSVYESIQLSALAVDAEGDALTYYWESQNGSIDDPSSADTEYTCGSAGRDFITVHVSDGFFADCDDSWQVEVFCLENPGGPDCTPTFRCLNTEIPPIEEDPSCMLKEPPALPQGCAGLESTTNPATCAPTGSPSLHEVQTIGVTRDCNTGFDLDRCDGRSCTNFAAGATGEGRKGVDNTLTALGVFPEVRLGALDQALYDRLCDGSIEWAFAVDPNPTESCVNVTPIYGGVAADPIAMNLSDSGCISGTLGTIPLSIAGVQGQLENAKIRGVLDPAAGFDGVLGATAVDPTATAIAETLLGCCGSLVSEAFDIRSDLEASQQSRCDALSLSLDIGGTVVDDFP